MITAVRRRGLARPQSIKKRRAPASVGSGVAPARRKPLSATGAAVLAKISPPQLTQVYLRTRLFKSLDGARRKHRVIWLHAPAGAGKTTLIASYAKTRGLATTWYQVDGGDADIASFFYYLGLAAPHRRPPLPILTPDFLPGLTIFTRKFFRQFFTRIRHPGVLVLDNYQEVPVDAPMQEALVHGFEEIPPGVTVVVVSRAEPPPAFARLRASGAIALIGWDDVKLTEKESIGLAARRQPKQRLPRSVLQHLHRHTQGWTAGMVLLLEQARDRSLLSALSDGHGEALFDYFASEIFRYTEPRVRDFLLHTAFLPKISSTVAQTLTGDTDAERILRDLARRGYFTVRHPGAQGMYEYHPLFRQFLMNQAGARFAPEQLREIWHRSAELLAQADDVEGAIALLRMTQDWPSLAALALQQAPLMMSQGRHVTLKDWLLAIPDAARTANPWIHYWLGICHLPYDQVAARQVLERAYADATATGDAVLRALAWSAIVQSYIVEFSDLTPLSKWLEAYGTLNESGALPPRVALDVDLSYMIGATFRCPAEPRLRPLAARLIDVVFAAADPNERVMHAASLIPYLLWIGGWSTAKHFLQERAALMDAPLARILWYGWQALHLLDVGDVDSCRRLVETGVSISEESGVLAPGGLIVGTGALAALRAGDLAAATKFRDQLRRQGAPTSHLQTGYALFVSGIIKLARGDISGAIEDLAASFERAVAGGNMLGEYSSRLAVSVALGKRGDRERAMQHISASRDIATAIGSETLVYLTDMSEANVCLAAGDLANARQLLTRALAVGSRLGSGPPVWCTNADVARLLALALEHDIESPHVRALIQRLHLPAPDTAPEHWPWPIKIHTLGRFEVFKDGKRIKFEGKAQRRPLDLLKALIAFGGRQVPEDKLSAALWPQAEGDAAHEAFAVTLHRLRRLLGSDDALVLEGRQLTLDAGGVWVDVWALERLLRQAENPEHRERAAEELLRRYAGPFLEDDSAPWVLAPRERLRSKFLRVVGEQGESLQRQAEWERAGHWYRRGIEIDPLAEEFYRCLMQCLHQSGRRAEALAVYRRCQSMLASMLDVSPAAETAVLYDQIRRASS